LQKGGGGGGGWAETESLYKMLKLSFFKIRPMKRQHLSTSHDMACMHCYEDAKHISKNFIIILDIKDPSPPLPHETALYLVKVTVKMKSYTVYIILTKPYVRLTFQTNFNKMQYGYKNAEFDTRVKSIQKVSMEMLETYK
jgi:hypothetical protein